MIPIQSKYFWTFKSLILLFLVLTVPFFSFQLLAVKALENDIKSPFFPKVALVLGAGITKNDQPSGVLKNRLDTAFELYKQGKIKVLLVSGDNRLENYNEPKVMKKYLVDRGVLDADVVQDFAGRRTLDSCYRAKNVFKLRRLTVITQAFHIPRAVFLCQGLGLEVKAVAAPEANNSTLVNGLIREIPASILAIFEINFDKSAQVLGDSTEPDLSLI